MLAPVRLGECNGYLLYDGKKLFEEVLLTKLKEREYPAFVCDDLNHISYDDIKTRIKEFDFNQQFEYKTEEYNDTRCCFLESPYSLILLNLSHSNKVTFQIWAESIEIIQEIIDTFNFPKPEITIKTDEISVTLHTYTGNTQNKVLKTPPLREIQNNYSIATVKQVKSLLDLDQPDELGKIILWHGPPGTGKTYLVRSALQEWHHRLKAQIEIILDPEKFFGDAAYMQNILTIQNDTSVLRIMVMEDAANFLDIGSRQNPGFARLLNMTDGLIGQGQRLLFLFTANEQLDRIDPAILRAGRCLQQLKIDPLTKDEAVKWLKVKKINPSNLDLADTSLASLFEIVKKNTLKRNLLETSRFGF